MNFTYLNRGDLIKSFHQESEEIEGVDNSNTSDDRSSSDDSKGPRRQQSEEYPRTIEFRHARGSLDPEDIIKWASFCLKIVELAMSLAQRSRTNIQEWDEIYLDDQGVEMKRLSLEGFMRDMNLDDETKAYWIAIQNKWADVREEDDRSDNEEPPMDEEYSDDEDFDDGRTRPGLETDTVGIEDGMTFTWNMLFIVPTCFDRLTKRASWHQGQEDISMSSVWSPLVFIPSRAQESLATFR